jgi:hypothetical protein
MKTETKTVHVVAWRYDCGVGFDWYDHPADADAAYAEEAEAAAEWAAEGRSAYRVDLTVPTSMPDREVTGLVYRNLDALCAAAPAWREGALAAAGRVERL